MKINNNIIVLDLETTSNTDMNGYQVNNDIIQIGAVLLNKELCIISSFDTLIIPREEISPYITGLTGISNEMVKNAPTFDTAANNFKEWVNSYVALKSVRLAAWGTYFDIPIFRKLHQEYLLKYSFSGSAFDVKTLAMLWMALANKRTDKLSVAHVANTMNLISDGAYHNALVDARMETQILQRIFKDFNTGGFIDGKKISIIME